MSAPATVEKCRVSIFLSYSTIDSKAAVSIRDHIERDGIRCFFAERDIPAQSYWEVNLRNQIRSCQLFLLLFSPASRDSVEVQKEVTLADAEGKEIWVVELEPTKLIEFFKSRSFLERQFFRPYQNAGPDSLLPLISRIEKRWPARETCFRGRVTLDNCPYPGPAPFSKEFADLFFGRLESAQALRAAVTGDKRVLLVWGPSGAGKTSLLTVGLGKALAPHYFYSNPVDGNSAATLLSGLGRRISFDSRPKRQSDAEPVSEVLAAIEERPETDFVFCFDQMENFFTWPPPKVEEINHFLESLRTILLQAPKRVTVLISFRKESLADVQPHIKRFFEDNWGEFIVRKLTSRDAVICMTEPAACRSVYFDDKLAKALIEPIEDQASGGEPVVDPMNIQKICQELWREVATRRSKAAAWCIDENILPEILTKDEGLKKNASLYVSNVLRQYLRQRISQIADSLPEHSAGPRPEEYVLLSLLEFVGPNNVRQRVRERTTKDGPRVGRLSLDVVNQLVGSVLVRRCGDKEYELAHDALAEEVAKYGESSASVSAMKNLDSVLARESQSPETGTGFNRDSELLARLEPVRENKWPFQTEEADLIFRRALGDHRRTVRGAKISVDAWARILAEKAPDRLIQALADGLSDAQETVQLDVLDLLLKSDVRDLLRASEAEPLGVRLSDIALDSDRPHEVREKASQALASLRYETTIGNLFASYKKPETRHRARTALALVRHAEDRFDSMTPSSQTQWRSVSWLGRLGILTELWRWRWQQSYRWMLYMIMLAAPVTAIGAALPFIPLGHFGASLTMDTDYSAAAGIFHGFSGGVVWGIGVTAGLLIYCVILRGGRIRRNRTDAMGMALAATTGGFLGGIVNTLVIALVFVREGLYRAGWFATNEATAPKLHQVFVCTRHGWIMPIFGAFLGVGIGLSLNAILGDSKERWRGRSASPLAKTEINKSFRRVCANVFERSWQNVLWIAMAVICAALIIRPGKGLCDVTVRTLDPTCSQQPKLPSKWVRSAGLGVVILGGSLGQEIGFLFGLLSVQFGVNLKENREFLRSARHLEAAAE